MKDKDKGKEKQKQTREEHSESVHNETVQEEQAPQEGQGVEEGQDNQNYQTEQPGGSEQPETDKEQELLLKLEESQRQAAAAKEQYVRLAAEFDNYRRRTAKERLELVSTAGEGILVGFLPVLDDCQRALDTLRKTDASEAAIEGTELIMNKLESFLRGKGIERIDAEGKPFDTDFHEAVAQLPVEESEKKNTVIDIVQEGYTLNGKVVRFAKVVVGI